MTNPIASIGRPTSRQLLARVLDEPGLAAQIQALDPPVLARLIDRVGLEDAGEIVALATTEQLTRVFDEDLWQSDRAGEDERFDADRFLVWLEVMLEAGASFVAHKLVELPEDLVTLAFHKHVLVLTTDSLQAALQDEDSGTATEKAFESCLYEELDDYHVISRRIDGWDSVLDALLALDREHHDFLQRLLRRCCRMSAEHIDDNGGLYDVLTSEEMLEGDVAGEREERRAEAGHVAPSTAASFLKLARAGGATPATTRDPVTRAYLRDLSAETSRGRPAEPRVAKAAGEGGLLRALRESGIATPAAPPPLLGAGASAGAEGAEGATLFSDAMAALRQDAPRVFAERSEELAYLANVLAAGCSFERRRFRPIEAIRAALSTCNLGLEIAVAPARRERRGDLHARAAEALAAHPADALFRAAWSQIHRDVISAAASVAVALLRGAAEAAGSVDGKALARAASRVQTATEKGEPWIAIGSLDAAEGLVDASTLDVVRSLMGECPCLNADAVGGRPPREDATRFIATLADVAEARDLLSRAQRSATRSDGDAPAPRPRRRR